VEINQDVRRTKMFVKFKQSECIFRHAKRYAEFEKFKQRYKSKYLFRMLKQSNVERMVNPS